MGALEILIESRRVVSGADKTLCIAGNETGCESQWRRSVGHENQTRDL